jgi:HEAT repeat protein
MAMIIAEHWDEGDELQLPGSIHSLVSDLAQGTVAERRMAREALIDIGAPAVPALTRELESSRASVRWEAATALSEIGDPSAAPALVQALEDDDASIRRVAARGLIGLGHAALMPLLEALEQSADSLRMREGARCVLRALVQEGAAKEAAPVLAVLDDIEAPTEAPGVAYNVLQKLYNETPA